MHSLASDGWYLALIHSTYLFFFLRKGPNCKQVRQTMTVNVIILFGLKDILRTNNAITQSGLLLSVLGNVLHCFIHKSSSKRKWKCAKTCTMYDVNFLIFPEHVYVWLKFLSLTHQDMHFSRLIGKKTAHNGCSLVSRKNHNNNNCHELRNMVGTKSIIF